MKLFEMWIWRRMETVRWTNEGVQQLGDEKIFLVILIRSPLRQQLDYLMRGNSLLSYFLWKNGEGKDKGKTDNDVIVLDDESGLHQVEGERRTTYIG